MQNFLSNIDIGVFDLDQVLKEGITSIVPDRFKNLAKSQDRKVQRLIKENNKLLTLVDKAQGEEKKILEDKLNSLKKEIRSENNKRSDAIAERIYNRTSFGGSVKNFTTTSLGRSTMAVGGIALRSIQKTFSDISQNVDETGFFASALLSDFDRLGTESMEFVLNNEKLYNSIDRNFQTFVKFRRVFGDTENISVKMLDNISQMENIIGLSNDEAISLLDSFRGINGMSVGINTSLIQSASMLSSANNVAFRDTMEDITNNAEFFSTYMSTSSDRIAEMIVRARRLGLSFSTFTKIFDSFSGIQETLETQARTSIFSGRRMDFVGILEKMQGDDMSGAMSSIMDQIGGISEDKFNNPFLRRQLAQGFGVDVQELEKLRRKATGNMSVDDRLEQTLVEFNENFKQLGFGTLKKEFIQYVVNPLSNLMKHNTEEVQAVFNGLGFLIKTVGTFTTNIAKAYTGIIGGIEKAFGSTTAGLAVLMTGLTGLVGAFGVSHMIEGQQLAHLASIDYKMTKNVGGGLMSTLIGGKDPKTGKRSGGVFNSKLARSVGVGGLLAGSLIGGAMDSKEGGSSQGAIGATVIGGALTGASLGAPLGFFGAVGGGILGGLVSGGAYVLGDRLNERETKMNRGGTMDSKEGGSSHGAIGETVIGGGISGGAYVLGDRLNERETKMNRGGIFTKRYTGKLDVAETGKPEGFVPLSVEDGKPTMPVNLSDDTIKRLASAMSKIKFSGDVRVDGSKTKKMDFYSQVMQPSSSLNV